MVNLMRILTRSPAKDGTNSIEKPKPRIPPKIPPGKLALGVDSLTHPPGMGIGWMIRNVEPERYRLTEPHGRVRDEQSLPTKAMVRRTQFRTAYRKGKGVQQPQHPRIIMPRDKLLFHLPVSHTEEGKCPLQPMLYRAMRIPRQITILVMTSMLARPPNRSALICRTPQHVYKESRE